MDKPTQFQIEYLLKEGWSEEDAKRGFAVVDDNGLGIKQIMPLCYPGNPTNEEFTAYAAECGFRTLPVDELPTLQRNQNYLDCVRWLDTPENRAALEAFAAGKPKTMAEVIAGVKGKYLIVTLDESERDGRDHHEHFNDFPKADTPIGEVIEADTEEGLIQKWKGLMKNPMSMWYWIIDRSDFTDGTSPYGSVRVSGAIDENDLDFIEEMSITITDREALIARVLEDYNNESTELNSLFFDFDVKMKKGDILIAYAKLQDTINGDIVSRYEDGKEQDELIPANEPDFDSVYEGNCKLFLESFNEQDRFRRYCGEEPSEQLMFIF